MAAATDVIDWGEAMQQVGDDEEFLRELLGDLRSELQTQLVTIQNIIQVGGFDQRLSFACPAFVLSRAPVD